MANAKDTQQETKPEKARLRSRIASVKDTTWKKLEEDGRDVEADKVAITYECMDIPRTSSMVQDIVDGAKSKWEEKKAKLKDKLEAKKPEVYKRLCLNMDQVLKKFENDVLSKSGQDTLVKQSSGIPRISVQTPAASSDDTGEEFDIS